MRRPTRREAAFAVGFGALVAVFLLWFPGCGSVGRSTESAGNGSIGTSSSFTISGDVSRSISPGELVALNLTLDNTTDHDLAIDRIAVAVVAVDAPRADADHPCSVADFEVRHLSGGLVLRLAGNSAETLGSLAVPHDSWPAVGMVNRPANQDGCKGASLTLAYEASGMEVPQ
jgi:hypothetical protein